MKPSADPKSASPHTRTAVSPAGATILLEPGTNIGDYRLDAVLGEGGMGVVYKAVDRKLGREAAIKFLTQCLPENRDRFLQEARLAARLNHPNIVTVYGAGEHDGLPYIATELLTAGTISGLMKRRKAPLTVAEACRTALSVARALQFAHARGIIHRDVKPSNILITDDGTVKLGDFGLAKSLNENSEMVHTTPGMVMGTPQFAAPEQCIGETTTSASDVYSLGCTLYFLLTGTSAFETKSLYRIVYLHMHEPFPDVRAKAPQVPAELAAVIARATAKRPEERYPDGGAMAVDLEAVASALGSSLPSLRWNDAPSGSARPVRLDEEDSSSRGRMLEGKPTGKSGSSAPAPMFAPNAGDGISLFGNNAPTVRPTAPKPAPHMPAAETTQPTHRPQQLHPDQQVREQAPRVEPVANRPAHAGRSPNAGERTMPTIPMPAFPASAPAPAWDPPAPARRQHQPQESYAEPMEAESVVTTAPRPAAKSGMPGWVPWVVTFVAAAGIAAVLLPWGSTSEPQATSHGVTVSSVPAGAVVTINGKPTGKPGERIALPPGRHTLKLEADGYEPLTETIEVDAGHTQFAFALRPKETLASITVEPADASVRVDGRPVEPEADGSRAIKFLAGAARRLEVRADGFEPMELDVTPRDLAARSDLRLVPRRVEGAVSFAPSGCSVTVDGRPLTLDDKGRATLSVTGRTQLKIEVSAEGHRPHLGTYGADALARGLSIRLEPIVGVVVLVFDPPHAKVWIDGASRSTTDGRLELKLERAGKVNLRAEAPDFQALESVVGPAAPAEVRVKLNPLFETIALTVEPANARVMVAGKPVTVTAGKFDAKSPLEGQVEIEIAAENFEPMRGRYTSAQLRAQPLFRLKTLRKTFTLDIDPPTARVTVNTFEKTLEAGKLTLDLLPDEKVRIAVSAPGHVTQSVDYSAYQLSLIRRITLDREPNKLVVAFEPPDAKVEIDGKPQTLQSGRLEVPPTIGRPMVFKVSAVGFEPLVKEFTREELERVGTLKLKAIERMLTIAVEPESAAVTVDGVPVPVVDGKITLTLAENAKPLILVRAPGHSSIRTAFTFAELVRTPLLRLEPVPTKPPEVKKPDAKTPLLKPADPKLPDPEIPVRPDPKTPELKSGDGEFAPVALPTRSKVLADLELVTIPAPSTGKVSIGTDEVPAGVLKSNEGPRHQQALTTTFLMGRTEVTYGQFAAIMQGEKRLDGSYLIRRADGTSHNQPNAMRGDAFPVTNLRHDDAVELCKRLSQLESAKEGREILYRLPTEAEWEYACRGDATGVGSAALFAKPADMDRFAVFGPGDPAKTAGKRMGPFGLYDMIGNVWEMTGSPYAHYRTGASLLVGSPVGETFVCRGGAHGDALDDLRCTVRKGLRKDFFAGADVGFRVVRER